ncbi:MAG: VTT domain-containing protein [Candidatus Dormiibacterota bacterium]
MAFIQGLNGVVAIVLLCTLLFAEESGVPLPVPGELTLLAAGVLIATGALDPWLFVPLSIAACLAGSITGYSWARLVGEHGLRAAAERFHQTKALERVIARLKEAGPREIAISRLIPGLRVYTTLVVGAAGVERRRFLIGIVPATIVWVGVFTAVGVVAGVPAERLLGQIEGLVVQGGILIVAGVGGYLAIRRVPDGGRAALARLPAGLRTVLAVAIDMGLVAAVVTGVLTIVRPLAHVGALAGWIDILITIFVIALFYAIATRRGRHATAGEKLLGTNYLTQSSAEASRVSLRRLLQAAREQAASRPPSDLDREIGVFRALSDRGRLRVVRLLLSQERSAEEVTEALGISSQEAAYALRELETAGIVSVRAIDQAPRYAIVDDHVRVGIAEFLTTWQDAKS